MRKRTKRCLSIATNKEDEEVGVTDDVKDWPRPAILRPTTGSQEGKKRLRKSLFEEKQDLENQSICVNEIAWALVAQVAQW